MKHWILIADAGSARVFAAPNRVAPLELVREFHNPRGRMLDQALNADQSGRIAKAGAPGTRSTMDPQTTAHEEAAIQFAHLLADFLRKEGAAGSYRTLSLVAPAGFLGELRPLLSKESLQSLRSSLTADLAHVKPHDLRPHLESLFVPGLFM